MEEEKATKRPALTPFAHQLIFSLSCFSVPQRAMRLAASSLFWAYIFLFGICIIAAVPNPPLYLQFGDDLVLTSD
jgi:hypothetical protein